MSSLLLPSLSLLSPLDASHFYARWINADEKRANQVAELAGLSLASCDFAYFLAKETNSGLPLPRAMRRLRHLLLAALIVRDLNGQANLAEVVDTMTTFADFAVRTHLDALHAEMVALYGTPIGEESQQAQELIVMGMGKLGGGELNVSSDIDLIFLYPEEGETQTTTPDQRSLSNHEFFTKLGKKLIAALSEITEDGFTFRVDMALRPNGVSGPLAASFNMLEEYFLVQGREWERYAWVKARALSGQADDIAALDAIVRPFVYRRYLDFGIIDAIRTMHEQIRTEVSRQERLHPDRSNNIKLGRGGIREIEFLVQVFQLIRGGRDSMLRQRSTRDTLVTLAQKQLLNPTIVEQLQVAYNFLRNLEHRLQYLDDAQTHTLPSNPESCLRVAQMMGMEDTTTLLATLSQQRAFVAAQFDAMFNDKNEKNAPSSVVDSAPPTSEEKNNDGPIITLASNGSWCDGDQNTGITLRLGTLGFNDATAASQRLLATLQSPRLLSLPESSKNKLTTLLNLALPLLVQVATLTSSTTSISSINSSTHFATNVDHQTSLARLLDFFETIARRAAYLSLLIEYPHTLERVIRMMHASDWAAKYLNTHPILLDELLSTHIYHSTPNWPLFQTELQHQLDAVPNDTERQMDILRDMHHAQLFRLLAQDLAGKLTVEQLADELSKLADIMVQATLQAVWRTLPQRHREVPQFAVIAYGKLGGKEFSYASDLDVIFLYDDQEQEAPALYAKLAQRFITWMTCHTSAGILFDVDIALRPDGASGLLVSSLTSFERYQTQSAWLWEHQALSRARFCAGDQRLGERFEALRIQILRQSREPEKLQQEVLSMRQKMYAAHPTRTNDFDLKQDAGGMIDIEFMVQFLVLRHAAQYPELTANSGNIALLTTCGKLGLINVDLALKTANAYRHFRRQQHQLRLQGKEHAKIDMASVADEVTAVNELWNSIFGLNHYCSQSFPTYCTLTEK